MLSRKTTLPAIFVTLLIAVISAEAGLLWRTRQRANKALAVLEQKQQARDWLARQAPAPTQENVTLTAKAVSEVRQRLEQMQRELTFSAESGPADPIPGRSADGFFALQKLGEDLRRQAQAARVGLRADERFGFGSHAQEGPADELLPAVHRQAAEVRQLVGHLLAAQPIALLSVKRENLAVSGPAEAPQRTADFFVPAPGRLVRQAGMVESDALRVEFTGRTAALREFMQALGTAEQPVLVRAVEVEPVAAVSGIAPVEAKFSVLLEVPWLAVKPNVSR